MLRFFTSLLSSRLVWGAAIVSFLSGLIWMFGPSLVIGGQKPLAEERNRLLLIVAICLLCLLIYGIRAAWRAWRRRAVRVTIARPIDTPQAEPEAATGLKESFEEALTLLRRTHIGPLPWYAPAHWWRRWGQGHLYLRPWYMLLGGTGSGKTTLLSKSQLHFPFAELFGTSSFRKTHAARQCDWWLTDQAVLLDTAGDFVWQESAQSPVARQWGLFLRLLRKARPRLPLNGVLLAISMGDLLSASADERQAQARSLHKRLQELHEQLRIRFPIYVVITKSDLLSGFLPYFDALDAEQRRQVWGFTFSEDSVQSPNFDFGTGFNAQLEPLQQRLVAGLPDVLSSQPDLAQRSRAFLLPQEFVGLRELLRGYLETVFSSSSFEARLLPRGVYFTSATQPQAQAATAAMPSERALDTLYDPLSDTTTTKQESTHPFFVQDLFEKAVFQESGLAESNRWWELRNAGLHWTGYATLGLLLVLGCSLWYASYRNNRAYLEEVALHVPPLVQQGNRLSPVNQNDLFRLLPYLDALRRLPDSAQFQVADPPLMHRLGLFQGKPVKAASQTLYQRALDTLLQPLIATQIRDILQNDDHRDADFSYQALKAYRMLFDGDHYDADFLSAWLNLNLRRRQTVDVSQVQWEDLDRHVQQLLSRKSLAAPFARDLALEARTSAYINQVPLSRRIYDRLKRNLEKSTDLQTLSLIDLAGAQAEIAFKRQSGRSLVEGIPGLYTRNGYRTSFDKQLGEATRTLSQEDAWIIGTAGQPASTDELTKAVRELYVQDFIAHWDGLLNDIRLGNVASLSQRVQMARLLSNPDSPMRRLLVNAANNLQLAKEDPEAGTKDDQKKPANVLGSMFPTNDTGANDSFTTPEQMVARHYRQLIELARPEDERSGSIAFDQTLKQVDDLYNYLSTIQGASNSGLPVPPSDVIARLQASAERLPLPFQPMLRSLAVGASNDTQSSEMEGIKRRIGAEVQGFCQRAIAGRYPLSRQSSQDIAADDFARMFAPGRGLMDQFFQQNLANKVDTSRTAWRFKPDIDGRALPASEGMLRPFQQAQGIRDTFFASGSQAPNFRVVFKPVGMDSDILSLSLDIDGQLIRYSHGPQVSQTVSWPGTQNGMRVGLQLNLSNGSSASLSSVGAWALHRFVDQASVTSKAAGSSRIATFNVQGHEVRFEIQPTSVRDPFSPPPFNCN